LMQTVTAARAAPLSAAGASVVIPTTTSPGTGPLRPQWPRPRPT
jgi:hypothetical protein